VKPQEAAVNGCLTDLNVADSLQKPSNGCWWVFIHLKQIWPMYLESSQ